MKKWMKKNRKKFFLFTFAVSIMVLSSVSGYARESFANCTNLNGTKMKSVYARGIDVSSHQGIIDWKAVKESGIDFAIIRCGVGMNQFNQDDPQWVNNVRGCEENRIPFGVYLYSYADSVKKAESEAEHVLRLIRGHKLTHPVYYDLEDPYILRHTTPAQRVKIAKKFTGIIKKAGYNTGIFATKNWFENELPTAQFDQWERWVAHWSPVCGYRGIYGMWQATNRGMVSGINGYVDLDYLVVPKPSFSVKNIGKKKGKVRWRPKTRGMKCYIYYSTRKNSGYKKYKTVSAKKGYVNINKKIKSKKKYFFKIRFGKPVTGGVVYGSYTSVKSLKTK
ncbi:MAG: glycoside hydrolase family 25 protein [Eubacterium sp.]|nr:glycoside hydrolase family 25 protein [Eubacterium sp.]MDD7209173.1 glycoside hydrolase family 25 protein [Lachnospiraceae bacterium]MDY5497085.1 glycoside hydrolase family 25 protein [Anaerobutyricum sp.]